MLQKELHSDMGQIFFIPESSATWTYTRGLLCAFVPCLVFYIEGMTSVRNLILHHFLTCLSIFHLVAVSDFLGPDAITSVL